MGVLLMVGTEKGLFRFRSDEARRTWTAEPMALPGIPVHATLYDPRRGAVLAAANHAFFGSAVRRSTDLGATWDKGTMPAYGPDDPERVTRVWQIAAGPAGSLLAGTEASGLFRSDDGGDSWHEVASLRAHPSHELWNAGNGGKCLHTIAVDPWDDRRLYIACSTGGVYRSDDGGAAWRPVNAGIRAEFMPGDRQYPEAGQCVHKIALSPARPGRIWLQNHGGVYRSDDGGESWLDVGAGLPADFGFPVLAHPRRADTAFLVPLTHDLARWFAGGHVAVHRTDDAGATWWPLDAGLPGPAYGSVLRDAMAGDGLDPLGVYFGTTNGGVFASADEGESWQTLGRDLPRILSVRAAPLPA